MFLDVVELQYRIDVSLFLSDPIRGGAATGGRVRLLPPEPLSQSGPALPTSPTHCVGTGCL